MPHSAITACPAPWRIHKPDRVAWSEVLTVHRIQQCSSTPPCLQQPGTLAISLPPLYESIDCLNLPSALHENSTLSPPSAPAGFSLVLLQVYQATDSHVFKSYSLLGEALNRFLESPGYPSLLDRYQCSPVFQHLEETQGRTRAESRDCRTARRLS